MAMISDRITQMVEELRDRDHLVYDIGGGVPHKVVVGETPSYLSDDCFAQYRMEWDRETGEILDHSIFFNLWNFDGHTDNVEESIVSMLISAEIHEMAHWADLYDADPDRRMEPVRDDDNHNERWLPVITDLTAEAMGSTIRATAGSEEHISVP